MPISTIGTTFSYSSDGSKWTDIPIKSYPDPVGASESIDVTTMTDEQYANIPGLKGSNSAMDFTANYDSAVYATISALDGEVNQKLKFSDGSGFKWKGRLEVSMGDGSVNAVAEMTLHSFKSGNASHFTTDA